MNTVERLLMKWFGMSRNTAWKVTLLLTVTIIFSLSAIMGILFVLSTIKGN